MTSTDTIAATAPPPTSKPPSIPDLCVDDIDLMSMPQRAQLLAELREHATEFGARDRWRNHEGVVLFFDGHALGAPGTWISRVNAAVLEAIARGIELARDPHSEDHAGPGARAWADYLRRLRAGELVETTVHAHAWSQAKRIATSDAVRQATARCGLRPTPTERRFLAIAQGYNWLMANREVVDVMVAFAELVDPALAALDPDAVDQLFAVGDATMARRGCEIAWAAASDPSILDGIDRLRPLLPLVIDLFTTTPRNR